jgi:pilus assembly protein Flp/PilA
VRVLATVARLVNFIDRTKRRLREESGQGMVEYGVIISLVAIAAMGVFTYLEGGISHTLCSIGASLGNTATCP